MSILTNFENSGMWISMHYLLHHTRQESIVPGKPETLLVEVVQHIVRKHVLEDRCLTSHGRWNIFAYGRKEPNIDIICVSKLPVSVSDRSLARSHLGRTY